ncbi:hypothetical protein K438DRAFT_2181008 [Mycena galopus ATCC 62051]|nr:hypothetical protein K438DRAFT_2181008 [Mycena galopus ATCC 62051]
MWTRPSCETNSSSLYSTWSKSCFGSAVWESELHGPQTTCSCWSVCFQTFFWISHLHSTVQSSPTSPPRCSYLVIQVRLANRVSPPWMPPPVSSVALDLRGFLPDPSSNVLTARGATVRFSTEGILESLDELVSGDGHRVLLEEVTPTGHILVGAEVDLWIIASGYLPRLFYGATLPTPPPPPAALPVPPPAAPAAPAAPPVPPVPGSSRVSPPPRPKRAQNKKEGRSRKYTPIEPRADRESGCAAPSQTPSECPTIRIPPAHAPFVAT